MLDHWVCEWWDAPAARWVRTDAQLDEVWRERLGIDFDVLDAIIHARLARVARLEIWPKQIELNDREIETLTWAARGKTSAEIAQILNLTKRTVDFHIDNARVKLGAATRVEAAIKAATVRLIEP